MDWVQFLVYIAVTGILLYVFQKVIDERVEKRLEKFKTSLQSAAFEHETRFAKLHEERAKIIVELFKLLVIVERSLISSSQGIHLNADSKLPRNVAIQDSKNIFEGAIKSFVNFQNYFDENRILLSEPLCRKIGELNQQYSDTLSDLEGSFDFVTPDSGGLPPAIGSLWSAQRKVKVIIPPIKRDIEQELRNVLGVENVGSMQLPDTPKK